MNPFRIQIQCHGNDRSETWCVQLFRGDVLIASVNELANPAAARQAGEFLLFGAINQWCENTPQADDIRAGVHALNAPAEELVEDVEFSDVDLARVRAIVSAVWTACTLRVRARAVEN